MGIDQSKLTTYQIQNFHCPKLKGNIIPIDDLKTISSNDRKRIITICNQSKVYGILFNTRLSGAEYGNKDTEDFVEWAVKGWQTGKYFVFAIRDDKGNLVGAIDIKSDNPNFGEIGYWMDENSPGYMTNAVIGLVEIAKNAGYKTLGAHTKSFNDASKRVLQRAGFKPDGKERNVENPARDRFVRIL